MDTTIVDWGYIGIMDNRIDTTIVYWGHIDNGKEAGNYYSIAGHLWNGADEN